MGYLTIIGEDGTEQQREVVNRSAVIERGDTDETLEPAVVQRIEYDHEGQQSSITTTCGETENRRSGDDKPKIVVEGILIQSQLGKAKTLEKGEEITLISDIEKSDVFVKRITIEQRSDVITFQPNGGEEELAFPFQLQLKQP